MAELTAKKSGYAWLISAAGFLSQLIVVFSLAMFGMTIASIAESLGVAVTALAICSSVYGLCYGGLGVVWGNIADRIGVRLQFGIASVGAGVFAILFGLFVNSVASACILYALVGCFTAGITTGTIPKLVTLWFDSKWRGRGIVIVGLGGTVAGMLLGVIAPIIIGVNGWQGCFEIFGAVNVVLGIIIFLILRDTPESIGTVPFGSDPKEYVPAPIAKEMTAEEKAAKKQADHNALIRVLKRPLTWKFGILLIFWQFCLTASSTYFIAAITFAGYSLVVAGLVSTLKTAGMFVGTLFSPSLSDKFGRKIVFVIQMFMYAILFAVFYFTIGTGNELLVYVVGFLCGICDAQAPIMQSALGECFPKSLRGTGPGMCTTISLVGRFFGPMIAAAIIVMFGGNTTIALLWGAVAIGIAGILGIIWLPKTGGKYGDPLADDE